MTIFHSKHHLGRTGSLTGEARLIIVFVPVFRAILDTFGYNSKWDREMTNNDAARTVPRWAADLVAVLSRDRPMVVTREEIASYLDEVGSDRDPKQTAFDLQRLGWLASLRTKGAWAFVPAGEASVSDPYIDLRAWKAREPEALFALAGEAAAWHLGYLPRVYDGLPSVWIPAEVRPPHGLRSRISQVRLDWSESQVGLIAPSTRLLLHKGLDVTGWASGLPALGPEALIVQLAARPSSFRCWTDLIPQLDQVASDCDTNNLTQLLVGQSTSAWQRAAYVLDRGGRNEDADSLMGRCPNSSRPVTSLGRGPSAVWSPQFRINDHLIAPYEQKLGKA